MENRATKAGVKWNESRRVSSSLECQEGSSILSVNPPQVFTYRWCVRVFVILFLASQSAVAAPLSANGAAAAVEGWLRQDLRPLGSQL